MQKVIVSFVLVLSAPLGAFAVGLDDSADVENFAIQVRGATELEMEREITIGDVAEFSGFADHEVGELKSIRLGDAPAAGESRIFTDIALSQVFRTHLPRLQANRKERIRLSIPSRVIVTRRTLRLEAKAVEEDLRRQVLSQCNDCEVEFIRLNLPLIAKDLPFNSKWTLRMRPEVPKGSFSVPLEIMTDAGRRLYWVTGEARIWRRVPVAKRAIEIGERIAKNDFAIERRDVTFLTDSYPAEAELVETVAARSISTESLIGRSLIRREQALRAGQAVKVIAGENIWQVSIDGIAQQGAFIGDLVRVRIPRTQKIISGILKDKGVVEVR